MHYWRELLDYVGSNVLQCAALILGVSEVLLARANNIWLYPTGIAAVVLSMYSLFEVQLYGECILHLYYFVVSIYGWMYWKGKQNNNTVNVSHTSRQEWVVTLGIVLGGWLLLYFFLDTFTDSQVPIWDGWVSATGWAGMWLLARRKVENWILLNISNAFAIPLLFSKGLPLFAILTLFLFVVACKGYFDWLKIARNESTTHNISSPS
jgi:nicotinamide mononucleotide transporter